MKQELKQVLWVSLFLIAGCIAGYLLALYQTGQCSDPAFIAFWTSQNMPVPEPVGVLHGVIAFGLLFSGIPTGLIFYAHMMQKWLTPAAPKIMIGFIAFPIYTLAGAVGSIPFLLCRIYRLLRAHPR